MTLQEYRTKNLETIETLKQMGTTLNIPFNSKEGEALQYAISMIWQNTPEEPGSFINHFLEGLGLSSRKED